MLIPSAVSPDIAPSDGVTSKLIRIGDPVTISFTIINEPDQKLTRERTQWVFIGSSGAVNLSCTITSKYIFSDDCLNLTLNNVEYSDAGLYQIVITTEAGTGMSAVEISIRGCEL